MYYTLNLLLRIKKDLCGLFGCSQEAKPERPPEEQAKPKDAAASVPRQRGKQVEGLQGTLVSNGFLRFF